MAYQVTATEGANAVNGILLRVKVLTAAASSQAGATKIADTSTTPFYDQSVTTTQAGSVVYGAMADGNTAFSMTADARTTLIDNFSDGTQGCQYATWRATAATGVPGATTLGATAPGGGNHGTYAAAEILAAGTITEDGSAPAVATSVSATAIQSAAFTPPAGSLLVALVAHCSSGVSSVTITNNGGALTWTKLAYESTAAGTGAGVWVAQVPGAPAGAAPPPLTVPGWIPGAPGMPGGEAFAPWPPLPEIAPAPDPPPPPGTEPPPPPLPLPPALPGLGLPGMPGGTAFETWPPPALETGSPPLPARDYITGLAGLGGPSAGYFTDERGNPRMVLGDAVWGLPGNAGRWSAGAWQADFDAYFATRGSQGFTVAYTKPMGTPQGGGINVDGRTFDGLFPFQGGSLANPSTGLTSAYWARIDYMLASALAQGITVFLNAIGYDSDFESSGPLSGKSAGEFQSYGSQLAGRYASTPNLVWMVADDYFGGADTQIAAFLTGLRSAGDAHPISIENMAESTSRQDTGSGSALAWGVAHAQYNFCYSYNVAYYGVEKAYAEASPLPVIQGDGYFYQGTGSYAGGSGAFAFDRAIRQDTWHAISSGARGIIHGDEACWQWPSTAQASAAAAWYHQHSAGNIRALMESLPGWHLLVPDASSALVTAGRGTHASGFSSGGGGGQYEVSFADSYVTASRTPSGDLAVIYLSHATTITIDQSQMIAGYAAFWADPITGAKTAAATGSTYNSGSQGNNSQGDPDWVLILQRAASAAFTPGAAAATGTAPGVTAQAAYLAVAGLASATGTAPGPAAAPAGTPAAGLASAAGSAPGATAQTSAATSATAGLAAGTGTAPGPSAAAADHPAAGLASATGSAPGATASTSGSASAVAGLAAATGTAPGAGLTLASRGVTGLATAAGTAPGAVWTSGQHSSAGIAAAAGTAPGPALTLASFPRAGLAAALAAAGHASGSANVPSVNATSAATVSARITGTPAVTAARTSAAAVTSRATSASSVSDG